jgi:hypothetical protein
MNAPSTRGAYPRWKFSQIASGGHMAPLTRPALTNPLIAVSRPLGIG